ncbi:MAG TPA: hypothetical protein EYQ83_11960, partial [Acidobacteria bacterium]|nr:hypothetical protein [Acidobacteriota bacterium]
MLINVNATPTLACQPPPGDEVLAGDAEVGLSGVEMSSWPEEERGSRLEYENQLLNGLLRDASVRQAFEFIRRDPERKDLIARTIELLLQPIIRAGGHENAPIIDPVLRNASVVVVGGKVGPGNGP